MDDFGNRVGLKGKLTPDNRKFAPSVMCFAKGFWMALIAYFLIEVGLHQAKSWYYHQEIHPYMNCYLDLKFPVSPTLIDELNATGGITCSTSFRAVSEACACCFGGECYRQITIPFLGNATTKVNVIDEIGGVFYKRLLPTSIKFCYLGLNGKEECKTEEGDRVGYILRVIEVFNGWPIGGQIVEDPNKNKETQGWFW